MARTAQMPFVTVRSEGGLLPPDLLARIATNDAELGGLTPADYGLGKGGRLGEATAQAWAACKIYWEAFKAIRSRLGHGESGVTETREQWVLPLFRELGYGRLSYRAAAEVIDERSYPISHRAGEGADAPPIHIVAVSQDLDRGEGKRTVSNGPRVSPQGLMQDYLNRTPHLWGMVTNGRQLRLLRDNESLTRAAYVEFNLDAMMEGGIYADFVLLYLLLHRSRLPRGQADAAGCRLERWRVAAVQGGTRALDALREGVTAALKALGQGLLEHPENDALRERLTSAELSVTDYYGQLLRLVYRLLFQLVAEERDLLFTAAAPARARAIYLENYSVSRLREQAERRRREDRHDDLWRALRITFGMMRDGCTPLGLQPLSGGLFNERSCPDLDGAQLANDVLLAAMRGLSLVTVKGVRRRVNYRDLNVEELGSVYESLLELHPVLRREGSRPHFELVGGGERKTTGSYYTPPQLVAELIKSALEPVVIRALVQGKTPAEKRRNLLSLKVCDPASGSGHLLLAAARRIGREVARLDAGEIEPDIETLRKAVREVIQRCIYGMDVNPLAVDLCRLALWIEGHMPGRPLTFLDHRIKCGNSLIGATPEAVAEGLPEGAFTPVSGDDRAFASGLKKRNRIEQKGQDSFFSRVGPAELLNAKAGKDEAAGHNGDRRRGRGRRAHPAREGGAIRGFPGGRNLPAQAIPGRRLDRGLLLAPAAGAARPAHNGGYPEAALG
jgi:N-6 DNA Methylase